MEYRKKFVGISIYFLLHSLLLLTSLSWYGLIESQLFKMKGNDKLIYSLLFVFGLTVVTILLHIWLVSYMVVPSEMNDE